MVGHVRAATREVAPWIARLARLGYASKGVVYAVIGLIAVASLFGQTQTAGSRGAFLAILRQPFGTFLLILIGVGLLGYALWRLVQAVFDPESKGGGIIGIGYRGWLVGRGLFHAYFAFEAFRFAMRGLSEGSESSHWVADAMDKPFGTTLVILTGIGVAVYGIGQIIAAVAAKMGRRLRLQELSASRRRWVLRISRYGLAARGVVFAVIGWFALQAGWQNNPAHARDIGEALRGIARGPRGPWILGLIAVGLISYGIYEILKARYRSIRVA